MTKPRVEVEMSGGVGNQLFQYAAAFALSRRVQAQLVLDTSWFRTAGRRLSRNFQLTELVSLHDDDVVISALHPFIRRLRSSVRGDSTLTDAQIGPERFRSLVTQRSIRMSGYWQSERYFEPIAQLLRDIIVVKRQAALESAEWVTASELSDSVGIHVRRGDYVSNRDTNTFHGVCTATYYEKGLEYVRKTRDVRRVFVFSDDIEWCKKELRLNADTFFVDQMVGDPDQLKLMSFCSHHVISNSSFSWWAAWLGRTDNQIVVYPEKWFANGGKLESMPEGWHSL